MDSSEDQNPIKQNSPTLPLGVGKNLQLPFFFSKIEVIAVIGLSLVAVAVKIFPQYFSFVSDLFAFFWLVVALIISVLLFYEGIMRFANTALSHYANNILWIIILGGMAAVTGGVKSPFLFLLFFPIVISTFDLLPRAPVILGALAGGLVLLMGVFVHGLSAAGSAYLLMALEAGAIYIFGYFVSLTVRETLHERYEKEELKAHYAEFTEIDRIKDSLTRIVMTEFHHPLEDIESSLHLAKEKISDIDAREIIERSLGTMKRLLSRIDDLAEIAGIERATFDLKKYNLTSLLNLLTYDLQTLARSRNVELKFISKPEAVEALIDQQKLGYAFSLIIDNAIRYSPNGKVTVNIDGTADDVAVVTVEDTGIGIAEAFRGRLFYKFSRAKDAARLEPSGLGISLYIVKHIINKHDGQISVETQEGKGTKVTIVLPKP